MITLKMVDQERSDFHVVLPQSFGALTFVFGENIHSIAPNGFIKYLSSI